MRAFVALLVAVLAAIGLGVAIEAGSPGAPATTILPVLGASGIGAVRFGLSKTTAVAELTRMLGSPSEFDPSSGCGPRYSEVQWDDLAVEFRLGVFSGYRFLLGGLDQVSSSVPDELAKQPVMPAVETSSGITLGSTLAQIKHAYGRLHTSGTFRWESVSGMIFSDNTETEPDPPTSRIVEIKIGTCGDY